MGSRKVNILLVGLCLIAMQSAAQQTIQFSQYVFNGLALNPAYAGYKDDWTLNLSSRIQWVGFDNPPKTGTASIDGLTDNKNIGLGFIATFDELGPESTTSAYVNYAYRLQLDGLDTKRLCFGIAAGIMQYRLDGSKFNATDGGDTNIPPGVQSNFTPDARLGIYYYSPKVYFGVSVFNLFAGLNTKLVDNVQLIQQDRTLYLTGGAMLPINDYVDMKPSLMIKEDFKSITNVDITDFIVLNKAVWFGASYRTGVDIWNNSSLQSGLDKSDAVAVLIQFYVNDHFRIGYSYDFTVSQLATAQSGTHELSLSLSFPSKKQRVVSPRYF